jgi:hypothetical protein
MNKRLEQVPVFSRVINEILSAKKDIDLGHSKRAEVIEKLENFEEGKQRTLILYIADFEAPSSSLALEDTITLSDILNTIGKVDYLDLLIHSPGGDGNAAEEIVDMCDRHCLKEFRVIVPFWAKSAATLIALCSDKIIMGETSQLGPIDPQIWVVNMDVPQLVSGFSFINSREELVKKIRNASDKGEDPLPYLQQLSTLNPAFVDHCIRLIEFTRDFGVKRMPKRMLKNFKEGAAEKARAIIDNFLSTNKRFHHGRMIKADEISKDPELKDLNVEYKKEPDQFWVLVVELFTRAYVYLQQYPGEGVRRCKLIEGRDINTMSTRIAAPTPF